MKRRYTMQFNKPLWETLTVAAIKQSTKEKKTITAAEYVRRILAKHFKGRR